MTTINPQLVELENKLTMLLLEIRGAPEFSRVTRYLRKMTGKDKLSDYLRDEKVPLKERAMIASLLTDILLTKDYSRLPELPATEAHGQRLEPQADSEDEDDDSDKETEVRRIVRSELAGVLETVAKALRAPR